MNIVRKGDTQALKEWVKQAPAVRAGIIAKDQLRQVKNTFIVTATLVSRAAIRGGMNIEDSLTHVHAKHTSAFPHTDRVQQKYMSSSLPEPFPLPKARFEDWKIHTRSYPAEYEYLYF